MRATDAAQECTRAGEVDSAPATGPAVAGAAGATEGVAAVSAALGHLPAAAAAVGRWPAEAGVSHCAAR